MPRAGIVALVLVAHTLAPVAASACAVCLDSAWGRRGFVWPFVVLMLAPFAVMVGLAAALAWLCRRAAVARPPDGTR
jgi:hypothetical protein